MGGGPGYVIPARYTGLSSWSSHQRRVPPSAEPGTDYYMPRGTPLVVPSDCRVVGVGGGIQPATGRFVTLDNGVRWIRYLHLLEQHVHAGQDLPAGTVFGLSGASGYGSEHFGAASDTDPAMIARTGGPHVHVTAFKGRGYTFGPAGTVDFHALTGGQVAGGAGAVPGVIPPTVKDEHVNDFFLLALEVPGGIRRYVVDPRTEAKREISSRKFDLYKNAGMAVVPGLQPSTDAAEFPGAF